MVHVETMTDTRDDSAARLTALKRISWVILLNKPFYPLYVWYFVGEGIGMSFLTLATAPFYAIVLLLARRSSLAARVAFPLLATLDTIGETKLFGAGSAAELFACPAALIAALSFTSGEARWLRGTIVAMYVAVLAAHGHLGASLYPWTDASLQHLREINIFAVASLTVFAVWVFTGRQTPAA